MGWWRNGLVSKKRRKEKRVVDATGECEETARHENQDGVCGRQEAWVVMNAGM
jgi:hypothetical protein